MAAQRMTAPEARALIRRLLEEGDTTFLPHAKKEMAKDKLTSVDVTNILRGGVVEEPEHENGSWRYRVRTERIAVVVEFGGGSGDRMEGKATMTTSEKKTKKCPDCGGPIVSSIGDYLYAESGLSKLRLVGIEVRRCEKCKSTTPVIPAIESLHRALAKMLIEQSLQLAGEEIRFLRKYLGFRAVDFAKVMGVTKETVSRWETGASDMGALADRLLRSIVQHNKPVASYEPDAFNALLRRISGDAKIRRRGVARKHGGGWEEAVAAE